MQSPDQPEAKDKLWSHIDQAAILRLHELDHEIDASHNALQQQLEKLCSLLTGGESDVAPERGLNRLLLVLDHSAHLTRQSLALIDERHRLLSW